MIEAIPCDAQTMTTLPSRISIVSDIIDSLTQKPSAVFEVFPGRRSSMRTRLPAGDCNHDQGTVHDIAYLGGFSIYHIQLASGKIVKASVPATRWRDEPAPTWGESVHLSWADNDAVVLTL